MNSAIRPTFDNITIRAHEVGLWFRHGSFRAMLQAGSYRVPGRFFGTDRVQVVDTRDIKFEHPMLGAIAASGFVGDQLTIVDVPEGQRALVWRDGQLGWSLESGRHAFWKGPWDLRVERFSVTDPRLDKPRANLVTDPPLPCCN